MIEVVLKVLAFLVHCVETETTALNVSISDAFAFFDKMQRPSNNCSGIQYAEVDMGCGGGFAAHFQLAASKWLRAAASLDYKVPVLIVGPIYGYSQGKECEDVKGDWTCFFTPPSSCQSILMAEGKKIASGYLSIDSSIVPAAFSSKGIAWWWGAAQSYLFRVNPRIQRSITSEAARMNNGKGFPFGSVVAGMHVRHGDKHTDGFKHHSFEAETAAILKSPEIVDRIRSSNGSVNASGVHIFVASDNPSVLFSAQSHGYITAKTGITQQISKAGSKSVFETLLANTHKGFNASLEIIADIYFLSKCSSLVGIAASQVFRMSVGISNASGTLKYAVAMDHYMLPKIMKMSAKYDLPVPETFNHP